MRRNKKKNIVFVLLFLIVGLSVGYSLLRTNLRINGTSKIKNSTWDIHFENVVVNTDSVELSTGDVAATISSNTTEVSYTVTLNTPGDFYEFTVDAVNAGSIDGMIESVTSKLNDTVITTLPAYLDYSVSYSDGVAIAPNHLLKAGESETYKVRVEFKKDIENSELPTTAQTLSFNFEVVYVQADENAVVPEHHTTQPKVPVSDMIYWALQDNNNDGDYEKLVISDSEVTGSDGYQGSFAGDTEFSECSEVPWHLGHGSYDNVSTSMVEEIKIEGIVAPASTAYWFYGISGYSEKFEGNLNDLNVSNVTNMEYMFYYAGWYNNHEIFNLGDLSVWDTSNVTDMSYMFFSAGYNATTFNMNLSGWNTSNVTDMSYMFEEAGFNATIFNLDLSEWDTSKVTDMSFLFNNAGSNATTFSLDFSGWDTSNVTNMSDMFSSAGYYATTWSVKIPSNNGGGINNTTSRFFGSTTSTYGSPDDGRAFTLVS